MTDTSQNKQQEDLKHRRFNLKDLFNRFVDQAVEDFPQLKDRLIFYSAPTNSWHGNVEPSPHLKKQVLRILRVTQEKKDIWGAFAGGSESTRYYRMAWIEDPGLHRDDVREIFLSLEHELAHLVVPAANLRLSSRHDLHFLECAADTFSVLRGPRYSAAYEQSFAIQKTNYNTTFTLVANKDAIHLTYRPLNMLQEIIERHDLSKLTPEQAANISYRITLRTALSSQEQRYLEKLFGPIAQSYQSTAPKQGHRTAFKKSLEECAKIMFMDHGKHSSLIFEIGKTLLSFHWDELGELFSDLKLESPFWDNVRQKIKEHEAELKKQETPLQKLERYADQLQALGYFDRDQGDSNKMIDMEEYESEKNQDYIRKKRAEYIASELRRNRIPGPTSTL